MTSSLFRKVVYPMLAFSIIGLALICLPIIGPVYTVEFAGAYRMQITVGYIVMILLIEVVGVPIRSVLRHYWAGMIFAFCLFIAGVLAGSSVSMFLYEDMNVHSYIVKPLFWLSFYGLIPAAVIGAIGSGRISARNKNGEQVAHTNSLSASSRNRNDN